MEQQPAVPVWITDLLSASFTPHEDAPNTITLKNGTILHKARVYGIAVSQNELVVDDGTGSILVRTFDASPSVQIGDSVLVIGRPRLYDQQPYLLGEIIKKIHPAWLELRKKQQPQKNNALDVVRALDKGDGADYNDVAARCGEEAVLHLLAIGELFETKPGFLKVLE